MKTAYQLPLIFWFSYISIMVVFFLPMKCAVAKDAFEANKVSQGFEALARAQSFLKSKVTLGKLALLSQVTGALHLGGYLLSLPYLIMIRSFIYTPALIFQKR